MDFALSFRDFVFLLTQVVIISTVIANNKQSIKHLDTQQESPKEWVKSLQDELKELRIRLGK